MSGIKIEVISPVGKAIERTKRILFPFHAGKWFSIGFCAFLAFLGQSGYNFNFSQGYNDARNSQNFSYDGSNIADFFNSIKPYLPVIIIVAITVGLAIQLVVLWLSCRGNFMFNHNIAGDNSDVKLPWRLYSRHANNMFKFLILAYILPLITVGLIMLGIVILACMNFSSFDELFDSTAGIVLFGSGLAVGLVLILMTFALTLFKFLTIEFITPVMITKNFSCLDAWKYFNYISKGHKGSIVLFLLFRMVLNISVTMIIGVFMCLTCCILCCLSCVPYIGMVALLPFVMFIRCYSLEFVSQFGEDVNIFKYYTKESQALTSDAKNPEQLSDNRSNELEMIREDELSEEQNDSYKSSDSSETDHSPSDDDPDQDRQTN